jgi:hypothetical protein
MKFVRVFGPLKKALKRRRFGPIEDAKFAVAQWVQQQPREFFAEEIHGLERQSACFSAGGGG